MKNLYLNASLVSFILSVGILCGWGRRSCACICTCAHKATLGTSCSKLRWWSMTVRMAHTISWTSTLLQRCVWWHSIERLKDTGSKVAKHYINLLSSENISVSPCKIQRQLFNYEKRIPKDIIYRLPPLKQLSFSWRFADIFLPAYCCFFHFMTLTVITGTVHGTVHLLGDSIFICSFIPYCPHGNDMNSQSEINQFNRSSGKAHLPFRCVWISW